MCLTLPAQIISLENGQALVRDFNHQDHQVIIAAIPEAQINDWILFHANLAINKISQQEATEINELLK